MSVYQGCHGSSKALAVINSAPKKGISFVVCKDEDLAKSMTQDIETLSGESVLFISDTETLPYDLENPHSHIRALRNQALHTLATFDADKAIVVCSMYTFAKKVACKAFWLENSFTLKAGDKVNPDVFENKLKTFAYEKEELDLSEPGAYVRNSDVFDIYSMGDNKPARVFIENGKVREIHHIDIETNRNLSVVDDLLILPSYEYGTDETSLRRARGFIRSNCTGNPDSDPVYAELKDTQHANGLEYFLPELCDETCGITDLVDEKISMAFFVVDSDVSTYWQSAERRYKEVTGEMGRVVLHPSELWLSPDDVNGTLSVHTSFEVKTDGDQFARSNGAVRQQNLAQTTNMLDGILEDSTSLVITASSPERVKQIQQILELIDVDHPEIKRPRKYCGSVRGAYIVEGALSKGFITESGGGTLAVVSDREIFGNVIARGSSFRSRTVDFQKIQDLENLKPGDPIVHLEYGVGRFAGLQTMDRGGQQEEFLKITYKEDVTAFVPMSDLYMVTRFGGLDTGKVPLDVMGSKKWQRNLMLSVGDIEQTAMKLVDLKEQRKSHKRTPFKKPGFLYHRFCNGFEFEPTVDQEKAFNDVINDLLSDEPMDRLIVGDVGFGKTEVALRAAFHAVENGQSVVVAAPTTILSGQHFHTFETRFEGFNVPVINIEQTTPASLKRIMSGDDPVVIVGTHSALRMKDKINDIGLFIIDEEHRFGARDKELISKLHGSANVLNMTATPIPRTLTLSLSGIRDISVIATAPSKRLAVRTLMAKPSPAVYREAIERELMRNGQVYILHNRTQTLDVRANDIKKLLPEARVATLHGKMSEDDQRSVLLRFARHEIDILVCTTIIEIGIDVPRANTIMIEDPERLGLSQMHQIRGRVGRSDKQGYAYILADEENTPETSLKRFKALIAARRLGDGFLLASHDLEIRGAGELLGEKQSGHIYTIGFSLYSRILMRAVRKVQEGMAVTGLLDRDRKVDLNLNCSGYIEASYIDKPPLRLTFYKRLSSAESLAEIRDTEEEMMERFGPMGQLSENLVSMTKIRLFSRVMGISKAIVEDTRGYIEPQSSDSRQLVENAVRDVAVEMAPRGEGYRFFYPMSDVKKRFKFMIGLMYRIQQAGKDTGKKRDAA